MKKRLFTVIYFSLTICILSSCASVGIMRETYTDPEVLTEEILCPPQIEWETAGNGLEVVQYRVDEYQVEWACVKINLDTPGLEIKATPHKEDLGTRSRLIKTDFKTEKTPSVSVNTTPFDLDGRTYIPVSIIKIDDEVIVPPASQYSALCFTFPQTPAAPRAFITSSQTFQTLENCQSAFGGFYQILTDGEITQFARFKRSRTACGISHEGRFLYLFATCGINCPTGRNGLNFEECAVILRALGCTDAMEFDGGHSTGLTLNGKNLIKPSLQRKVPAALAIFTE